MLAPDPDQTAAFNHVLAGPVHDLYLQILSSCNLHQLVRIDDLQIPIANGLHRCRRSTQ